MLTGRLRVRTHATVAVAGRLQVIFIASHADLNPSKSSETKGGRGVEDAGSMIERELSVLRITREPEPSDVSCLPATEPKAVPGSVEISAATILYKKLEGTSVCVLASIEPE